MTTSTHSALHISRKWGTLLCNPSLWVTASMTSSSNISQACSQMENERRYVLFGGRRAETRTCQCGAFMGSSTFSLGKYVLLPKNI